MTPAGPGLREHLELKRRAMAESAAAAPTPEAWDERISATCVSDDFTGVRKLDVRGWRYIGDGGPGIGGNDLGPTSPELFCGVVSTCFTHTVLCLAAVRGVPLDSVRVEVSAINNDANFFGVPSDLGWVPRELTVDARVRADGVPAAAVEALVREAGLTCPIMQLVRGEHDVALHVTREA